MLQQPVVHSRRLSPRVETHDGVWVYWSANGREDTARVRNLSLGGLFMQTSVSKKVDSMLKLDFLVQEGRISVDAIVRRAEPGRGLALKFTKVRNEDQARLNALVNRFRQTREATNL